MELTAFDMCRPGDRLVIPYPIEGDEQRVLVSRFAEGLGRNGWRVWLDQDRDAMMFYRPGKQKAPAVSSEGL